MLTTCKSPAPRVCRYCVYKCSGRAHRTSDLIQRVSLHLENTITSNILKQDVRINYQYSVDVHSSQLCCNLLKVIGFYREAPRLFPLNNTLGSKSDFPVLGQQRHSLGINPTFISYMLLSQNGSGTHNWGMCVYT